MKCKYFHRIQGHILLQIDYMLILTILLTLFLYNAINWRFTTQSIF